MIRDQIIEKCVSSKLRVQLLREADLTLERALMIARASENATRQAQAMESAQSQTEILNRIQPPRKPRYGRRSTEESNNKAPYDPRGQTSTVCYCCGSSAHRTKGPKCRRRHDLRSVTTHETQSRQNTPPQQSESSDDEHMFCPRHG